jgi:uncharacterized membrane protein YbhN (UPF0104 family)
MDAQMTAVFKPSFKSNFLMVLMVLLICAAVAYGLSHDELAYYDQIIIVLIGVVAVLGVLSNSIETITVTPQNVLKKSLFGRQQVPIGLIRYAQLERKRHGRVWLIIKTDEFEFFMGNPLGKKKIREAVACILEQIRLHYPEHYEDVKLGRFEF